MTQSIQLLSIPKLDSNGVVTSWAAKWKNWKRGFSSLPRAFKMPHESKHYNYIVIAQLHSEIQDIFDTLPNNGTDDDCETQL